MSRTIRKRPSWDRPEWRRNGRPDARIERAYRKRRMEASALKMSIADAEEYGLQEARRVAVLLGRVRA